MWPTLLRRTFLGQLLLAPFLPKLLARPLAQFAAQPVAPELWAAVPPELRYVRIPLAESENAWTLWKQAIARFKTESDALSEGAAFYPEEPPSTGAAAAEEHQWLADNAEPWRLIQEGLARGRLQVPLLPRGALGGDELTEPMQLRSFGRLMTLRAKHFAARGALKAAVREWLSLKQTAEMLAEGEGYLVTWLIAVALWGTALSGISHLARHPRMSLEQLKELQATIDERILNESLASVARVELCEFAISYLDTLPTETVALLVELDRYYGASLLPNSVGNLEREFARRSIVQLLDGHPEPFDKVQTVAIVAAVHRSNLADFDRPLRAPAADMYGPEIRAVLAAWPKQLQLVYSYGEPAGLPSSLTADELQAARLKLREITNPLGKLLAGDLGGFGLGMIRATYQINSHAAQLVVALRIHHKLHHAAPERLAELVDWGILKQLPLDPNAEQPFGYSREKSLIWTVDSTRDYQPQDEATLDRNFARRQWPFNDLAAQE